MPLDLLTNATLPTATTTVLINITSNPKPIHPVATIVGSVHGAMLLVLTVLNVLLWYRRFRSSSMKSESEPDTQTRPFEINVLSTPAPYHDVLVAAESHKPALPQLRLLQQHVQGSAPEHHQAKPQPITYVYLPERYLNMQSTRIEGVMAIPGTPWGLNQIMGYLTLTDSISHINTCELINDIDSEDNGPASTPNCSQ
ncbi:hypothetical protein PLEOSDRAFT_171033 [Pleurotus ostreatus PC15]|uniref:Uncharacterized protein n=1 Tax=Pleurotus ostreatus (strain PC15) TaxID=1137138 RepID=A0A067NJ04_PLEO1|nr:hypothetical protein PLEOSDRAFT_171033 [Pleurotus ostreatus PC15]